MQTIEQVNEFTEESENDEQTDCDEQPQADQQVELAIQPHTLEHTNFIETSQQNGHPQTIQQSNVTVSPRQPPQTEFVVVMHKQPAITQLEAKADHDQEPKIEVRMIISIAIL